MTTTLRLEQKQLFRGRQTFALLPSAELHVATRGQGGRQEFTIELSSLSPRPVRFATRAGAPLFGAILFSALYLGMIVSLFIGLRDDRERWVASLTLSGMIGLFMIPLIIACFARWRRMSCDVTAFSNRWTGNVAVSINNNGPEPSRAADFIAELTRRVEQAEPVTPTGDTLVDQLARLHELHRRGVLSADEFAAAKQRALSGQVVERKIGF